MSEYVLPEWVKAKNNTRPSFSKGTHCYRSARVKPELLKPRRLVKWHEAEITCTRKRFAKIQHYVNERLANIPRWVQRRLVEQYAEQFASKTAKNPERAANIALRKATAPIREILDALPFKNLKALRRDAVLEREAKECADYCLQVVESYTRDKSTYDEKIYFISVQLNDFISRWGLHVPFFMDKDDTEFRELGIVRAVSEDWWLSKLKKLRDQTNEFIAISAGYVRKGKQEYCSNITASEYRQQRKANLAYLEAMEVVNEETEERTSLKSIHDATTANPEKRRIELMVRCRGLEELAEEYGCDAFFVTWTAPSKYHRISKKWNQASPTTTQKYLCSQWAKCRAKIKRAGIEWFGVRVAEPHADATPHWHMLVFCHPDQKETMQGIMYEYALQHDASEKGALQNRLLIEEIDPDKGSATGYIAKYISKNINANHLDGEHDHSGSSTLVDSVDRVSAWASRWRIRQFQFFGSAAVTIWRECRRIKTAVECEAFEKVRNAADNSRWAEFTKLLRDNPVSIQYEQDRVNKYGEAVKVVLGLVGVVFDQVKGTATTFEKITREVKFRLERRKENSLKSGDSRSTWSTVNNCTEIPDRDDELRRITGLPPNLVERLRKGAGVISGNRHFQIINGELRDKQAPPRYLAGDQLLT